MVMIRIDASTKKEKRKHKAHPHRILLVPGFLGLVYFCYAYRKHYNHDGLSYINQMIKPSTFSRLMKSVHLFPTILHDTVRSRIVNFI